MLKRKLEKVTNTLKKLLKSGKPTKKFLVCKECDEVEVEVAQDIKAVTCAYCVQRSIAPPPSIANKASETDKFPRGWALKARYVHTDGRVFVKGKPTGETETVPAVSKKTAQQKKQKPTPKPTQKKRKAIKKHSKRKKK